MYGTCTVVLVHCCMCRVVRRVATHSRRSSTRERNGLRKSRETNSVDTIALTVHRAPGVQMGEEDPSVFFIWPKNNDVSYTRAATVCSCTSFASRSNASDVEAFAGGSFESKNLTDGDRPNCVGITLTAVPHSTVVVVDRPCRAYQREPESS